MAEYKFDQSVGVPWIIGKIQCVLVGFLSAKIELQADQIGVFLTRSLLEFS